MYYIISTDDIYSFSLEKFETEEETIKALNDSTYPYDYRAIIKGNIILEEDKIRNKKNVE